MGTCANCSKEGATARCSRCKSVTYCSRACQASHYRPHHKKDCKRIARENKAASETQLLLQPPPLHDEWGLTRVNDDLVKQLKAQCVGLSDEAADKVIYAACFDGDARWEAMFLTLFPFGRGYFGDRDGDLLFADYVNHLLKLSTGAFLQQMGWIAHVVRVTATIRAVRGGGPPQTFEKLSSTGKETLAKFLCTATKQRTFCLRYLLGDDDAFWLSMVCLRKDMGQQA